tara:strand:+ start:641 stop:853 length:213 start_codon:yes stop_codon:yes gene_type:complete
MNELINGIPLGNSVHLGSHSSYDNKILNRLNEINPNLSVSDTFDEVLDIINDVKTAIANNPNTHVNNLIF